MKKFLLGVTLASSAHAANYNHLICKNIQADQGIKSECYAATEVQFEDGSANTEHAVEMQYEIQADFDCPGNWTSSIVVRAGASNAALPLRFGTSTLKIFGTGPVVLEDQNSAGTSVLPFSIDCTLSFRLKNKSPSPGQIQAWIEQQSISRRDLNDLISLYQTRTSVMFWERKVKEGDTPIIQLVTKLRDDTQELLNKNPHQFVLRARLKKYNDILNSVPREVILESYRNIFNDIKHSVGLAEALVIRLKEASVAIDPDLASTIITANTILAKGFST